MGYICSSDHLATAPVFNFFGNVGIWKELPLPSEIYDYNKYTQLDNIEEKDNDNIIQKSKFIL